MGNEFMLVLVPDTVGNNYAAAYWAQIAGALNGATRFSHGRPVVCCVARQFTFCL